MRLTILLSIVTFAQAGRRAADSSVEAPVATSHPHRIIHPFPIQTGLMPQWGYRYNWEEVHTSSDVNNRSSGATAADTKEGGTQKNKLKNVEKEEEEFNGSSVKLPAFVTRRAMYPSFRVIKPDSL